MPKLIQIVDGVIETVETAAEELLDMLEHVGEEAVAGAETFVSVLAKQIAANGGKILQDAAAAAVAAAESGGGTGQQKLQAALAAVGATLAAEGIPMLETAARGAIEAAVATMNFSNAQAKALEPTQGTTDQ